MVELATGFSYYTGGIFYLSFLYSTKSLFTQSPLLFEMIEWKHAFFNGFSNLASHILINYTCLTVAIKNVLEYLHPHIKTLYEKSDKIFPSSSCYTKSTIVLNHIFAKLKLSLVNNFFLRFCILDNTKFQTTYNKRPPI